MKPRAAGGATRQQGGDGAGKRGHSCTEALRTWLLGRLRRSYSASKMASTLASEALHRALMPARCSAATRPWRLLVALCTRSAAACQGSCWSAAMLVAGAQRQQQGSSVMEGL